MRIYFAGSIRGGRDDRELYLSLIKLLQTYGEVLTEHIGDQTLAALGEATSTVQTIYQRDMAWIEQADVIVAEVTTPSLGVGYELAQVEGVKPVLCLYRPQPDRTLSAMVAGNPKLQIRTYTSLDEAARLFEEFFHTV